MSWLKKLEEVLGSAAHIGGEALQYADYPRRYVGRPFFGDASLIGTAAEAGLAGLGIGQLEPGEQDIFNQAFRQGGILRHPVGTGIAAWEQLQNDNPALVRGLLDIGIDPLTYLTGAGGRLGAGGAGMARAAGEGTGLASRLGVGIGRGIEGAARAGGAGNYLVDTPFRLLGEGVGKTVGRVGPIRKAFAYSPRGQAGIEAEDMARNLYAYHHAREVLSGKAPMEAASTRAPAVAPEDLLPPGKDINPITPPPAPPVAPAAPVSPIPPVPTPEAAAPSPVEVMQERLPRTPESVPGAFNAGEGIVTPGQTIPPDVLDKWAAELSSGHDSLEDWINEAAKERDLVPEGEQPPTVADLLGREGVQGDFTQEQSDRLTSAIEEFVAKKYRQNKGEVGIAAPNTGIPLFDRLGQKMFGTRDLPPADLSQVSDAIPLSEMPNPDYAHPIEALAPEEQAVLNKKLEAGSFTGKTYREVYDENLGTVQKMQDALNASGVNPKPNETLQALKRRYPGIDKDTWKAYSVWSKVGDALHDDPVDLIAKKLSEDIHEAHGVTIARTGTYNQLKGFWSDLALLSGKYIENNIMGNAVANVIEHGFGALPGPMETLQSVYRRFGKDPNFLYKFDTMTLTDTARKYGYHKAPWEVAHVTSYAPIGGEGDKSQMERLLKRIMGKPGEILGKPATWNRKLNDGMDQAFRGSNWDDGMDAAWAEGSAKLQGQILDAAKRDGLDITGAELLPTYDPAGLYTYYRDLGMSEGRARWVMRQAAGLRNSANETAIKRLNKSLFSYKTRNIDEFIGKFMPFHYWGTRALRFYGENALRHPILLSTYARSQEGMERLYDDPGFNARQKGFMRLLGGPTGFTMLMNPDALWGIARSFGVDSTFTPEGETELGHIMRKGKEHGIGIFPWFDGLFNLMGTYGDTFEPDLLGIRHRALIGSAVNYARAQGWLGYDENTGPAGAPYASAMGGLRGTVSGAVSSFAPGWLSHPVQARAVDSQTASLDTIIENRIIAEHPDWTNQQLLDVMNNPDSDAYQSAYADAAAAGVIGQLLNIAAPFRFKVKENTGDVRKAQRETIRTAAEQAGANPYDWLPTTGDVKFQATYEHLTGKPFQPGDYQRAIDTGQMVRATPDARRFVTFENEFQSLGTPKQREIYKTYEAIRNGTFVPRGLPPTMDANTRQLVADRWVSLNDPTGEFTRFRALQQAYRQTHPEFDKFKQWQRQVYNVQDLYGSLAEYRTRVAEGNPNAAAYFAAKIDEIKQKYPQNQWLAQLDKATTSSDAYLAIVGVPREIYDPQALSTGGGAYDPASGMLPQEQYQNPSWIDVLTGQSQG